MCMLPFTEWETTPTLLGRCRWNSASQRPSRRSIHITHLRFPFYHHLDGRLMKPPFFVDTFENLSVHRSQFHEPEYRRRAPPSNQVPAGYTRRDELFPRNELGGVIVYKGILITHLILERLIQSYFIYLVTNITSSYPKTCSRSLHQIWQHRRIRYRRTSDGLAWDSWVYPWLRIC